MSPRLSPPAPAMRSLQARCEIGRVTDDGLFLRGAFSHEIADHYQAGRDADAHLEFLVARVLKAPTTPTISKSRIRVRLCFDQRLARSVGPFSVPRHGRRGLAWPCRVAFPIGPFIRPMSGRNTDTGSR